MQTIYKAILENGYAEFLSEEEAKQHSDEIEILERDLNPPVIEEVIEEQPTLDTPASED